MRPFDAEMVEYRPDVVGGTVLRVGRRVLRHVGGRIAPGIEGDAAITLPEVPHLRLPAPEVAGEFMDEDHRRAGPRFFDIQPDSVLRRGVRHGASPPRCRRSDTARIAEPRPRCAAVGPPFGGSRGPIAPVSAPAGALAPRN